MPQRQSKQHKKLFAVLKSLQKNLRINEEHAIKYGGVTYLLDLFIPQFGLAFEVQGEQHLEFSPFFHKNKGEFVKQQRIDMNKCAACTANNIRLLYIYPDDAITQDFILDLIEGDRDDARSTTERNTGNQTNTGQTN